MSEEKVLVKDENMTMSWGEQRDRMYNKISKWRMNAPKNPENKERKLSLLNQLENDIKEFDKSNPTELMKPCVVDIYDYYFGKKSNSEEGEDNIDNPEIDYVLIEKIKAYSWPLK